LMKCWHYRGDFDGPASLGRFHEMVRLEDRTSGGEHIEKPSVSFKAT
jgi:hypothetical protein